MSTTTQTPEQKARDTVKRAYALTAEALKETGASGNRLEQLIITLTPKVFEAISDHTYITGKPQAPPVTTMPTNQPSISSSPSHVQLFNEFLKRLPAELRNLLRMKDHTGTEILIVSNEKFVSADFAAICRAAEELGGKWVSAGKDSAWHLPLTHASTPPSKTT